MLGTIYGGDGRTTFGLPDMRGRIPLHAGTGPGLSSRNLGSKAGGEKETLTENQMPSHNHTMSASPNNGDSASPVGKVPAVVNNPSSGVGRPWYTDATNTSLHADALTNVGGSQSHSNLMPTLCVHFIIALVGIYPSRN